MKIAAGSMTPQVDISKKEYFKPIASCIGREDACADALPELDRLPNATEGSQPSSPFLVQPSISPNTGEISAIISSVYKNGDPKQKEWGLQTKYLACKFESLVNPVLPQDFGFAVLDEHGKV